MAEKILLEQFNLIEAHILKMLSASMTHNLMAMQTQVGFLKAKTLQMDDGQLQLNK